MNRVCKIYVKNVKSAFPIIGKSERLYIKKLQNYLEEYCNEYNISSLEELYKNFGLSINEDFDRKGDPEKGEIIQY